MLFFLILTQPILIADAVRDPLLVVSISTGGELQGKVLSDKNGRAFYAFQKIPFAKKPIGDLRFKAPQAAEQWHGVLNATEIAPACLQNEKDEYNSEDCLYLNVFTRRNPELHPVMVYLYGGALTGGSSNPEIHLGPQYLLTKDIVLVTINYRVGLLGFLSYEDADDATRHEISANNGFKDQVFALQWIQDNIQYFGGDANRVTVFGNSAGGISAHLLLISPLTENLFHRVIIQSGTALTRGLAKNNSAVIVGEILGLNTSNATELVAALRNLTESQILALQTDLDIYKMTIDSMTLAGLVLEKPGANSFMTENPWTIIQTGNYHRRPVMTGVLNAEGLIYYVHRFLSNTIRYFDINAFVPYYYKHRDFATLILDEDFFPTQNYTDISTWIDLWGYSSFIFDIVRCVLAQIKWNTVYFYQFEIDSTLNWSKRRTVNTSKITGACHGDELGYLFFMNSLPKLQSGSFDELSIERMVTLWTNFAIYGVPIIKNDSILDEQEWLPVQENAFHLMKIGRNLTAQIFDVQKFAYWKQLYDLFSNGVL